MADRPIFLIPMEKPGVDPARYLCSVWWINESERWRKSDVYVVSKVGGGGPDSTRNKPGRRIYFCYENFKVSAEDRSDK